MQQCCTLAGVRRYRLPKRAVSANFRWKTVCSRGSSNGSCHIFVPNLCIQCIYSALYISIAVRIQSMTGRHGYSRLKNGLLLTRSHPVSTMSDVEFQVFEHRVELSERSTKRENRELRVQVSHNNCVRHRSREVMIVYVTVQVSHNNCVRHRASES